MCYRGHCLAAFSNLLSTIVFPETCLRHVKVKLNLNIITAKISVCAFNQGMKTHSSLRQTNLQLQNEAALMSCRIRAVEYRKYAARPPVAQPGLQDRILLNCTRVENAHTVRKKTCDLLLCSEVQHVFTFPFSLLRHYQMLECFYVDNCCFWARATVLSSYRNW